MAIIDSGASDCFLKEAVLTQIPSEYIIDRYSPASGHITLGDSSQTSILETVRILFFIAGVQVAFEFHVVAELLYDIIIGRNLLSAARTEINFKKGYITFFNGLRVTPITKEAIPPMSEVILPVKVHADRLPGEAVLEASHTVPLLVENCIYAGGDSIPYLKVLNPTNSIIVLDTSDILAYAETNYEIPRVDSTSIKQMFEQQNTPKPVMATIERLINQKIQVANERENKREEIGEDEIQKIDLSQSCLNDSQKERLRALLRKNRRALAFSIKELGECNLAPMKIRVDDRKGPIMTRPFRHSPQKVDIIDAQVRELLDLGVIEPSTSSWRSNLVVVKKKNGSPRLCTDFRPLNAITYKDKFPMPTARSLFLYMAYKKPTIWSSIDLLSGFHQCVIEPDSRKYTAFESSSGVYEYSRIPFGLVNSPYAFTKVLALALRGLVPKVCLAYLDDIIIYDSTFEDHLQSLDLVLQALIKANLKLKPEKCDFCRKEIHFLGHVITPEGLKTQPRILNRISAFGKPHNVKTLQSFLGLLNYYRSFIPRMADIAKPLYDLTKKGIRFVWSEKCESAFNCLKELLTKPPLLIHPRIGGDDRFFVLSDASDTACGAALCHRDNSIYRPISFYGCVMNQRERNYSATEREGLSVIRALQNYEDMIQGAEITVITDHKPLVSLLKNANKNPSPRIKRWGLYMSAFDIDIEYEAGKTHYLADYLSRTQTSEPIPSECMPDVGPEILTIQTQDTDSLSIHNLIREQKKDPECKKLFQYIKHKELPDNPGEARNIVTQADFVDIIDPGVLCHFPKLKNSKFSKEYIQIKPQIIVPDTLIPSVLSTLHDNILVGAHVGKTALLTKVTSKFYWKGMHRDIMSYVRSCSTCALRKRAPHPKAEAKSWERNFTRPFQVIQVDFIGPLRKARTGARYIMTFIDLLTGWPEAFCTKDSTAVTAASILLTEIVCRYGVVDRVHSDRGATFLSHLFKSVTGRVGCRQTFTTGRNPTGNARVERMHKTLENVIAAYINDEHDTWPQLVPIALWSIRSSISMRTGFSPFELMYGRPAVSMGIPALPQLEDGDVPETDSEKYLLTYKMIKLFNDMAGKVTDIYESEMRGRLDAKARPATFEVGDLVYTYEPHVAENRQSKFSPRYRGPFRVIETKGDNLVKLISLQSGKELSHLFNISKLKRAYLPWSPAKRSMELNDDKINTEDSQAVPLVNDQSQQNDTEGPDRNNTLARDKTNSTEETITLKGDPIDRGSRPKISNEPSQETGTPSVQNAIQHGTANFPTGHKRQPKRKMNYGHKKTIRGRHARPQSPADESRAMMNGPQNSSENKSPQNTNESFTEADKATPTGDGQWIQGNDKVEGNGDTQDGTSPIPIKMNLKGSQGAGVATLPAASGGETYTPKAQQGPPTTSHPASDNLPKGYYNIVRVVGRKITPTGVLYLTKFRGTKKRSWITAEQFHEETDPEALYQSYRETRHK